MDDQSHPKFGGLVLDDEQHFIMRGAIGMLGRQNLVKMQITAIGHFRGKRCMCPIVGGIKLGHCHTCVSDVETNEKIVCQVFFAPIIASLRQIDTHPCGRVTIRFLT